MKDTGPTPSLAPAAVAALFPFYVEFDQSLRIRSFGPSFSRLFPEVGIGVPIGQSFEWQGLQGPPCFDTLLASDGALMCLRHTQSGRALRGQVVRTVSGDSAIIAGAPWFMDIGEVDDAGLGLTDFASHDRTFDMLQLVVRERRAVDELERLTKRLTEQREQLRNGEREARSFADQAQHASRATSEYVAIISHEILTTMNGIIGMTALIADTPLTDHQAEMVEAIRSSSNALMSIIDGILDLSKIETERVEFVDEPYSIEAVVEGVVDLLGFEAQQKDLELTMRIDHGLPETMMGDAGRLRQICMNLLGNAIKFTEDGEVCIEVSRVVRDGEPFVSLAVTDTGVGIPAHRLSDLFVPFSQTDGGTTRKQGGAGLGLAICHGLLTRLGGRLDVQSQEWVGSRFTALLPLRGEPGPTYSDILRGQPPSVLNQRVLIADRSPSSVRAAMNAFHALVEPVVAVDGESEVVWALRHGPAVDLLLIDRRLFGRDVSRALGELAAEAPPRCPTTVLTGSIADATSSGAYGGAVQAFVTRPLKPSVLRGLLTTAPGRPVAAAGPEAGAQRLGGPTHALPILLVEDNETNARLATLMVEKLGMSVVRAVNGAHAIQLFRASPFPIVLMDCHMPVLDGYEATRGIRQLEREAKPPMASAQIIALTANAMAGEREHCLACGMDDYLVKPVKAAVLQAALERALDRLGPGRSEPQGQSIPKLPCAIDSAPADKAIAALIDDLGPETTAEIMLAWVTDAPRMMEQIEALAGGPDQVSFRRAAHSLKGSSAIFALDAITSVCQELELLAVSGSVDGQAPLVVALRKQMNVVAPWFEERMKALA